MSPIDSRISFVRHTQWLAISLEALVLVTLLSGVIPFEIGQPVWWLRLSDAIVSLAPVLLVGVILLRLGCVLLDSKSDEALISSRRSQRMARRWAIVFVLLVPLQLLGFAWLYVDSDSQLNRQIREGESNVAALQSSIVASGSQADLQSLLASANTGPVPPLEGGSLVEQKQKISAAIAINTSRLSNGLRDQRSAMLRSSLPGTLRVFFGAAIASAFLGLFVPGISKHWSARIRSFPSGKGR